MGTLSGRRSGQSIVAALLCFASVMHPRPAVSAPQSATPAQDLETARSQLEESFRAALAMSDEEPMEVISGWGTVMMQAAQVELLQRAASGAGATPLSREEGEATIERVLERWQRLRPASGGPALFRTFRIGDPEQKRAAMVALLDRYPDDALVLFQAVVQLRGAGEIGRADEAAEAFLARHPDRPTGYRLLAGNAGRNETRLAEVLMRWAQALPGAPDLVLQWLASGLPAQEPEATDRVLGDFFARKPAGERDLVACIGVLRGNYPSHADEARSCVARTAADPAVPGPVAEQATAALAESAGATGDTDALAEAVARLEPAARGTALIAAARAQKVPEGCTAAVDLLRAAAELPDATGDLRASVASALQRCAAQPAAQHLYLSLLRTVPAGATPQVLSGWVFRVNGAWKGELPAGTAIVLEQRLEAEPESPALYRALDIVYQVTAADDQRLELLRRWRQAAPGSFDGRAAVDLAVGLAMRNDSAAAIGVLEDVLRDRFTPEAAELLWELYSENGDTDRAQRLAGDLLAAEDLGRRREGHLLAGRAALVRRDLDGAEDHYWRALEGSPPRREIAVELLAAIAWLGQPARLQETARRLCEETGLAGRPTEVPDCAADLLSRAGQGKAAAPFFAARAADLPEDPPALRELAFKAQAAGEADVAERALRRALEIDPRAESSWVDLGNFLEKQGRAEEAADLLRRSRVLFSPPPTFLYRATGRALVAAGQPKRAIDLLLEARGNLPDNEGGQWSRSWIDQELRDAYAALGRQAPPRAKTSAPGPFASLPAADAPTVPPTATAGELRVAGDALLAGTGGRYDPVAALDLYTRAASQGDPLATFRLALVRKSPPAGVPTDEAQALELYRRSAAEVSARADRGDAYARYLVGTAALLGLGNAADPALARRWLEAAAASGESGARRNLGWMEETGTGFAATDTAAALVSYRLASQAGDCRAMFDFARLALTPESTGAVCEEGRQWVERAARAGHPGAASLLAKSLYYGAGDCVARDRQRAWPWLEAAAESHQPGGDYDFGLALVLDGKSEADRAQGLSLLERAAAGPDALSAETLAFLTGTGVGARRDPARHRQWVAEAARLGSDGFPRLEEQVAKSPVFRDLLDTGARNLKALAENGDVGAMALLARLGSLGMLQEIDARQVVELARRAASAGEAPAMRLLSAAYRSGDGVAADLAQSRLWRQRCAAAGDSFCMMFLGNDLLAGEEVERDVQRGVEWLGRSAAAGNWWAVGDLGNLYDEGWYGVARDPTQAAVWKRLRAELGDAQAAGWLLYHGYR